MVSGGLVVSPVGVKWRRAAADRPCEGLNCWVPWTVLTTEGETPMRPSSRHSSFRLPSFRLPSFRLPSFRLPSWLVLSLFAALPAVVSGCVIRAQPQPVYANDPNYVPPQPVYATDPNYVPPQTAPVVEVDATVYPSTAAPPPVAEYRPPSPGYG